MEGVLILFFDEDCLMCSSAMRVLHRLDGRDALRFAALGGETAEEMGIENGETMVVVQDGEAFRRSEAVRMILMKVVPVLGWLMLLVPLTVRDWVYTAVAARRQWFSKGLSGCEVPEEGMREKVLR